MGAADKQGDLVPGTLDMLVLRTLARGSMHGYGITEFIQSISNDVLRVEEGALYPALNRLELRGLLASEWGVSENNRRARFYSITRSGRKQLAREAEEWHRISGAIGRLLSLAHPR
jgi:transcriptional regulator